MSPSIFTADTKGAQFDCLEAVADSDEVDADIIGIRVSGFLFSFYKIPHSKSLLNALRDLKHADAETEVKK